jgi:hypothetical protein
VNFQVTHGQQTKAHSEGTGNTRFHRRKLEPTREKNQHLNLSSPGTTSVLISPVALTSSCPVGSATPGELTLPGEPAENAKEKGRIKEGGG